MDNYFGANEVVIPGMSQESQNPNNSTEELVSRVDIAKEVSKEVVSTTVIEEVDTIEYPMVCIRADKVGSIQSYSIDGLRAVISSCRYTQEEAESGIVDDSVPIYIYTSSKILKCGTGSYNKLYKYLYNFVRLGLSEKAKVYYFESQDKKSQINKVDFSKLKLDI